jgi:hypothetical protein
MFFPQGASGPLAKHDVGRNVKQAGRLHLSPGTAQYITNRNRAVPLQCWLPGIRIYVLID